MWLGGWRVERRKALTSDQHPFSFSHTQKSHIQADTGPASLHNIHTLLFIPFQTRGMEGMKNMISVCCWAGPLNSSDTSGMWHQNTGDLWGETREKNESESGWKKWRWRQEKQGGDRWGEGEGRSEEWRQGEIYNLLFSEPEDMMLENTPRILSVFAERGLPAPNCVTVCLQLHLWALRLLLQWVSQWISPENWSHIPQVPSASLVETQITALVEMVVFFQRCNLVSSGGLLSVKNLKASFPGKALWIMGWLVG